MKSLILLWEYVLIDLGRLCCVSTSLDLKKAQARFEHEGVSFLTITLPRFAKDFEKSLESGVVRPSQFAGFQRRGGLPLFMGGFLDGVFDRSTGMLLQVPDTNSIFAVRQACLSFGKIQLECSKERKAVALDGYLQCEKNLQVSDLNTSDELLSELVGMSTLLFREVFTLMDSDVYKGNIRGKHGPGKTADRLSGNAKYDVVEWPARLEAEFPYGDCAIPNPGYNYMYCRVKALEPGQERPAKVTLVPKTLEKPRVISVEPTAMQYQQQGIAEKLVDYLERDKILSGMIGFVAQEPNQLLARVGSRDGSLATLDLSEASDRVSNQHVRGMLQRWPSFMRAVDACRSRKAVMPGGKILRLVKFASMGSALCFPFEAMVFLSIIFLGIQDTQKRQFTRRDFLSFHGKVRVYGDDIVVPVETTLSVIHRLEAFGYKVNVHKSFWNGMFRESCGKEYYDGSDVSITRVRRVLPASRDDVREIISAVALRNQFYSAGLWGVAKHLDELLGPVLKRFYPVISLDVRSVSYVGIDLLDQVPDCGSPLLGDRKSVV